MWNNIKKQRLPRVDSLFCIISDEPLPVFVRRILFVLPCNLGRQNGGFVHTFLLPNCPSSNLK